MSYRVNPFTGQFDDDGVKVFASMAEAPSAAAYGVGPAWIGGRQYWSDSKYWRGSPKSATGYGIYDDALHGVMLEAQQGAGLVDVFLLSDSNAALGGNGWDAGIQAALGNATLPAYGTGFVSANENNGNGAGTGHNFNYGGPLLGATTGADAFCENSFTNLSINNYAYLGSSTAASGVNLSLMQPIAGGINDSWVFRIGYGKWATGGGAFTPMVRLAQAPYTTLATGSSVPFTGGDSTANADLAVSVSGITVSTDGIECPATRSTAVTAKSFFSYMSAHRATPARGFAGSVLYGTGGKKIGDVETEMAALTSIRRAAMLMHARQRQLDLGRSPTIVIVINFGMNDKATSVTKTAYQKSLVNVMQMMSAGYVANGGIAEELHWLLMPSHRITDNNSAADQTLLNAYCSAADDIASGFPRCGSANLSRLMTYAEAYSSGWYDSGGSDVSHLLLPGNTELAKRALEVACGIA